MTNDGRDQERELPEEIIRKVAEAATKGAIQVLGPGRPDLVEEIVAEVNLQLVLYWKDNPPRKPAGWAFISATNLAKRLGKKTSEQKKKHVDLSDAGHVPAPVSLGLDQDNDTSKVEEALEALDKLVEITNQTIHDVGSEVDRRIFVLFHVRGLRWEQIAPAVKLSTTATHRRYYRLITQVTGLVWVKAQKDPKLNHIFQAILIDEEMFRCALLGLLNVIARKGFPGIREILESFLSL